MDDDVFSYLAELAARVSGQAVSSEKAYLMEARLSPIVRREGFAGLSDLVSCLRARPNPAFDLEVASALLSGQTSFFRDRAALTRIVSDVVPARAGADRSDPPRIWVAGGGTGQEAYSLAMLQLEAGADTPRAEIVATDVSKAAIQRAEAGVYGHFEVQKGLSVHRLLKFFTRQSDGSWRIGDEIRCAVSHRRHNLLDDMSVLGRFDVILCRHVLFDLSPDHRRDVVSRLVAQLKPRGLLFLGAHETLEGEQSAVQPSRDVRGAYETDPDVRASAAA